MHYLRSKLTRHRITPDKFQISFIIVSERLLKDLDNTYIDLVQHCVNVPESHRALATENERRRGLVVLRYMLCVWTLDGAYAEHVSQEGSDDS